MRNDQIHNGPASSQVPLRFPQDVEAVASLRKFRIMWLQSKKCKEYQVNNANMLYTFWYDHATMFSLFVANKISYRTGDGLDCQSRWRKYLILGLSTVYWKLNSSWVKAFNMKEFQDNISTGFDSTIFNSNLQWKHNVRILG